MLAADWGNECLYCICTSCCLLQSAIYTSCGKSKYKNSNYLRYLQISMLRIGLVQKEEDLLINTENDTTRELQSDRVR